MSQALEQLRAFQRELEPYRQALNLLNWDLRTRTPKNGVDAKLQTIAFFSGEIFRRTTSPEYGALLETLRRPEEFASLPEEWQITVERRWNAYQKHRRIPADFNARFTAMRARCEKVWEQAKQQNDYDLFAPWLEQNLTMTAEYIHYLEPEKETYEALLGQWQNSYSCEEIDALFAELKAGLLPLLAKIRAAGRPDTSALDGFYDPDSERKAQDLLLDYIGFDFDGGTTGESAHGLTSNLGPGDVRITNHFRPTQPIETMFTSIHEGGHALFEQGVAPEYRGTALAELTCWDVHESQSRFFENILGRNPNFWQPIYARLGEVLPQLKTVPPETFCRAINDVHSSEIRTEADELTYCLHIILRFELEKALYREHLPVSELRDAWNAKTEELLGIVPSCDARGILQDLHWASIYIGYFPTYLLGSLYDGMLLEQLEAELGDVDTILAEGRVQEITAWLREKVHRHGSRENARQLLQRVCGKELSAQPLLRYFTKKYSRLYDFE